MNTTVVEIRIHLPTGQVVTKTDLKDVFTFPPINLRTPVIGIFEGEERAQQVAIPPPIVAVLYRDDEDRSTWHRWYGAKLELVERETRIEVPRLVT